MSIFVVPKDKQAIVVHFYSGEKTGGDIFLERVFETMPLRNRMIAFLENEMGNIYFPFRPDNGSTEFISKNHILAIEAANDGQGDAFCVTMNIKAALTDGSTVTGTLVSEVPAEQPRLSDCLNQSNRFLVVKTGASLLFLNKNMIKKVMLAQA